MGKNKQNTMVVQEKQPHSGKPRKTFKSFQAFYPFYLKEHSHPVNRALHFFGTTMVLLLGIFVLAAAAWTKILLLPICGYGFAWIGHFFFGKLMKQSGEK